jgi:hexokinase
MKLYLEKSVLSVQFQFPDFVLKTQRQIAKDFMQSGIDFEETFTNEVLSLNEIIQHVSEKLEEVLKRGETATLQLLYQIDIPQNDFLALTTSTNFIPKMCELIVRRTAYKVYLRNMFS